MVLNPHLWFMANIKEKAWMEPEELVAINISGSCEDGPKESEYIVDGYVPLLKLYDCKHEKETFKNLQKDKMYCVYSP